MAMKNKHNLKTETLGGARSYLTKTGLYDLKSAPQMQNRWDPSHQKQKSVGDAKKGSQLKLIPFTTPKQAQGHPKRKQKRIRETY